LEERRDTALIAILTDGAELSSRLSDESDRASIEALLRLLSHFPALAFVDFARGARNLQARLRQFDLNVIRPEALPEFLGSRNGIGRGGTATERPVGTLVGDVRAWAAALALAPFPVDPETAMLLRARLSLRVSPWKIDTLRARAPGPGGRLEWTPSLRAELLDWLVAVSRTRAPSLLEGALAFWRSLLEEESKRRSHGPEPWQGTFAEQRLRAERALLDLWDAPTAAIPVLYGLYQAEGATSLQALIRRSLERLGPASCRHQNEGSVALPWTLEDRTDIEKLMLARLGFGGQHCALRAGALRRPGSLHAALGMVGGVAAAALALATIHALERLRPNSPPLTERPRMQSSVPQPPAAAR
jgi:hypothetical protein